MNGAPVYWNSPTYGPAIYVWPAGDPLKVFRLVGGLFMTPAERAEHGARAGRHAGRACCRSRPTAAPPGTGILWAALSRGGDANHAPQPGILRAYDASNVTRELWNSQQNAARDALGNFSKFSPPTVANGKVYVASAVEQAGRLRSARRRRPATPRRSSTPASIRRITVAGHGDADRNRDRRRQPGPAGTAHDDVEPGQRSGRGHLRRAECADDDAPRSRCRASTRSASPRSTAQATIERRRDRDGRPRRRARAPACWRSTSTTPAAASTSRRWR